MLEVNDMIYYHATLMSTVLFIDSQNIFCFIFIKWSHLVQCSSQILCVQKPHCEFTKLTVLIMTIHRFYSPSKKSTMHNVALKALSKLVSR